MALNKYTVKEGRHWSWPLSVSSIKNPREIAWEVLIDESAIYDLKSNDQYDWNKLLGIKRNFFRPREHSFMLAHRWNTEMLQHEFSPYIHLPGQSQPISFTNKDHWFSTPEKCNFVVEITIRPTRVEFKIEGLSHTLDVPMFEQTLINSTQGRWWEISTWFGGNMKAPSNYSVWKEKR